MEEIYDVLVLFSLSHHQLSLILTSFFLTWGVLEPCKKLTTAPLHTAVIDGEVTPELH